LQELAAVLLKKTVPRVSPSEVRRVLVLLREAKLIAVDHDVVLSAMDLCEQASISWWDALIVSAANAAGCDELVTEDLQHGQKLLGVRIVNPFV
jgi:predicted nucleic acid-binding protein